MIVVREERDRYIEIICYPNEEYRDRWRQGHTITIGPNDYAGPNLDVAVPPRAHVTPLRPPTPITDMDRLAQHAAELIELARLGRELEQERLVAFEATYTLPLIIDGEVYRRLSRSALRVLRDVGIAAQEGDEAYVILPAHTRGCVEQALAPYGLRLDTSEPLCDGCLFKYTLSEA